MRAACVVWLLASIPAISRADDRVPDWFRLDPARPYRIFDAWRNLSTREAALYLGSGWTVAAGILQDEEGVPIADCPMTIGYHGGIRGYGSRLRTDGKGYFIVYSPYRLPETDEPQERFPDRRVKFSAYPGYPYSQAGFAFASASEGRKRCRVEAIRLSEERCFCILTCARESRFDPKAFEAFQREQMRKYREREPKPYRTVPRPREGSADRGLKTTYRVRVVSPDRKPIADARVFFSANDGIDGNGQVVATDDNGLCLLDEHLLADRPATYYENVKRRLGVEAPGYGVGPISFSLKADELNTIVVPRPASVSGRLVDWNGHAIRMSLRLRYRRPIGCSFELWIPVAPDGTFRFDRVMPGEEFWLDAQQISRQVTPFAPVETKPFTLRAGEAKAGLRLVSSLPSALRGIAVDQSSKPVETNLRLSFFAGDRGWGHGDPTDGRFGTFALNQQPLQVRARAAGFEDYLSEAIHLQPGELRFLRLVLTRK